MSSRREGHSLDHLRPPSSVTDLLRESRRAKEAATRREHEEISKQSAKHNGVTGTTADHEEGQSQGTREGMIVEGNFDFGLGDGLSQEEKETIDLLLGQGAFQDAFELVLQDGTLSELTALMARSGSSFPFRFQTMPKLISPFFFF